VQSQGATAVELCLLDEDGRVPSIAPHDSHLSGLGSSVLKELGR